MSLWIAKDGAWHGPGGAIVPFTPGELGESPLAGSLPVGEAAYPVPAGTVLYVSPTGDDGASGGVNAPKRTLAGAISAAPDGASVVLRAGEYHEQVSMPSGKTLTIQAYPGETVWFDGSSVYTDWSGIGPWTTTLGFSWQPIDSSRYGQEGDGLANLPEQVWINGIAQTQIADGATPSAGQFSVNRTDGTLTLGTDPSGKEVRIADLRYWMIAAGRVVLRGFGVRRYSPSEVEGSQSALLYVAGSAHNSEIENVVFSESGMHGLAIIRPVDIKSITIEDCNNAGMQVTTADGAHIEQFVIRRCNLGGWQREPITAGIKITRTDNIIIKNGIVDTIHGAFGVWFDVSCTRFIVANVNVNATDIALESELSGGGFYGGVQHHSWFINCRTTNSADWAVKVFDTDYLTVANCNLDAARVAINAQQDARYNTNEPNNKTFEIVPWVSGHNRLWNNKITGTTNIASVIAYHDPATAVPDPDGGANSVLLGWDFFDEIVGNWVPTNPPGSMLQMGKVDGTRTSYNTWAAAASSDAAVGGPPGSKLGTNHQGSTNPNINIAVPLPEDMAEVLGAPAGTQRVGTIVRGPVPTY
jgi:hypothetical protein